MTASESAALKPTSLSESAVARDGRCTSMTSEDDEDKDGAATGGEGASILRMFSRMTSSEAALPARFCSDAGGFFLAAAFAGLGFVGSSVKSMAVSIESAAGIDFCARLPVFGAAAAAGRGEGLGAP